MKSSIALVGFMATGKTAVGQALAARLGKRFIETDALIEKKAGRSIPDIFRDDGEIAFRELEIDIIKEISTESDVVIACGGGAVLNKINIDRLKINCTVINLKATLEVIAARTSGDRGDRPLLDVTDRLARIRELLEYRRPFYRRAADIEIDTSRLNIDGVVRKIVGELDKDAGNR
jgi:shikimate kinase